MKQKLKLLQNLSATSRLCLILCVFFILSLIPLLHIGIYNHPAGDDFAFGLKAHLAWEETHSLTAVLKAAFENTRAYYHSWQGTYSSIFLMSLQPAVLSERLYPLTTIVMLGMLICSHLFLFYTLFTRYLKLRTELWLSMAISVLFLSVQILGSAEAAGSAFFWFNGALHYVFMHSVMIFLIACLLYFLKAEKTWQQVLFLGFSCFLAIVVGGANFVTALVSPALLSFLLFFCFLRRNRRGFFCALPLFLSLAGLYFNVSAPGNAVRMTTQAAPMSAPRAIYWSFIYAVEGIGEWTTVYVLFFVILLLPFLASALYHTDFDFPLPGIAAGLSFCILAATYTPSLYSMGHVIIFERTLNIMRMTYYLLLFLNLLYLTGWLMAKCRKYDTFGAIPELFSKLKEQSRRGFCLCMLLASFSLLVFSDKNKITSLSAVHSLRKGYAQSYHEETLYRIALLTMEGVEEVWIPNYSVRAPLMAAQDISTDTEDYTNQAMASWYGKKIVHLSLVY